MAWSTLRAALAIVLSCASCSLVVPLDDLAGAKDAAAETQSADLLSLSFNPTSVAGGTSSTGTVVLTGPAPANGASVALSSTSTSVSVPSVVLVKTGDTFATFIATTTSVQNTTSVDVDAVFGSTKNASLVVTAQSETIYTSQVPATNTSTGNKYELGTRFMSAKAGTITALRFWKAPSETGTHTAHLWSDTGTLLGSVTFTSETTAGWQEQQLSPQVPVAANVPYRVSYNINVYYSKTDTGLSTPIVNVDLTATGGCSAGPGLFPSNAGTTSFFADVRLD